MYVHEIVTQSGSLEEGQRLRFDELVARLSRDDRAAKPVLREACVVDSSTPRRTWESRRAPHRAQTPSIPRAARL